MRIIAVNVTEGQHPLAETSSYEALCDGTVRAAMSLPKKITLMLSSPTFFKSTATGSHTPHPTGALVFSSLYDRWQLFASTKSSDGFLDYVQDSIRLIDEKLELHKISGKYNRSGSVGSLSFYSLNPDSKFWVFTHILAQYALFAGVGKETASGFGQCHLVR